MEKYIKYYYGLNIDNISNNANGYTFTFLGSCYLLKKCSNINISSYYNELEYQLRNYQYFFYIVYNRFGNLVTVIDNINYILLKISNIRNEQICIFDLKLNLLIDYRNLKCVCHYPWEHLWERKIDYFEKYLEEKYEQYNDFFWMFQCIIGMGELALSYLRDADNVGHTNALDGMTIQHDRIDYNTKLYDYYDPSQLIIDHSSRDLSEYIKTCDADILSIDTIDELFSKYDLSEHWMRLFYSRVLFPSNIFDSIEKLMHNDIEYFEIEKQIINNFKIVSLIGEYLAVKYNIPIINFKIK